jgi:hypothetical protein
MRSDDHRRIKSERESKEGRGVGKTNLFYALEVLEPILLLEPGLLHLLGSLLFRLELLVDDLSTLDREGLGLVPQRLSLDLFDRTTSKGGLRQCQEACQSLGLGMEDSGELTSRVRISRLTASRAGGFDS